MQWSDITRTQTRQVLRQFAGLWLVVFTGLAAWRAWSGAVDGWTWALAILGLVIGSIGLAAPAVMRPIYTGWMVAVFPIGWTVSRLILAGLFFLVFTPVALVFRLMGRDALRVRKASTDTYWVRKEQAADARQYLRQF